MDHLIFVSTCSNYGVSDTSTLVGEDAELNPVSLYAETKVAVETHLAEQGNGLGYTALRLATVYGAAPRMRFDLTVNQFTIEAFTDGVLEIYGEQFWRPYVHVEDVGRAIATVLANPEASRKRTFNVGDSGENYTKRMMYELLKERLPGAPGRVGLDRRGPPVVQGELRADPRGPGLRGLEAGPGRHGRDPGPRPPGRVPGSDRRPVPQLAVRQPPDWPPAATELVARRASFPGRAATFFRNQGIGTVADPVHRTGARTVKGMTRFRRHLAATAGALGVAAIVAGTATAATVTNIDTGNPEGQPLGIVAGPGGNMWFADAGRQLGEPDHARAAPSSRTPTSAPRLPPRSRSAPTATSGPPRAAPTLPAPASARHAGHARRDRRRSSPCAASNLQGITAGPDGNLWFVSQDADALFSVSTSGTVSGPFPTAQGGPPPATQGTGPKGITRGPAGDPNVYIATETGVSAANTSARPRRTRSPSSPTR